MPPRRIISASRGFCNVAWFRRIGARAFQLWLWDANLSLSMTTKNQHIDFNTIKLIIWDLDDTFWKGTISEGAICLVDQNILLLKAATDCGVMNSICSKNHFNVCKDELEQAGLLEYFIFPSIDWTPKGVRVKRIIEQCQLRAGNVLYLDHNSGLPHRFVIGKANSDNWFPCCEDVEST